MKRFATRHPFVLGLFVLVGLTQPALADILIFSTCKPPAVCPSGGYGVPETISVAPSGFGSFVGDYFIPDANGKIWRLPQGGGSPVLFADVYGLGALFLPTGWGTFSGELLVVADTEAQFSVFASDGTQTKLDPNLLTAPYKTPVIAPDSFLPYGGHLFVSDLNDNVWRTPPPGAPGTTTLFKNLNDGCPPDQQNSSCPLWDIWAFGLEFTPADWPGPNRLLVSDGNSGRIAWLASNGSMDLFTIYALQEGQLGLRQMLVTPPDYLAAQGMPGTVLLVSVSGSQYGGGALGAIVVVDSGGNQVGYLKVGDVLDKFDPRGMLIRSDGNLLVSDASDPILLASPSDFVKVLPEKPTIDSSVAATSLWPPNHNLVNVGLSASASPDARVVVSVFSDEADQADTGDGNFSPDAKDVGPGTLRLRAERNGNGDGRVYLIIVKAISPSGGVAVSCDAVVVPHSQSKKDKDAVDAQAGAAKAACVANGAPPAGYFVVGDGPVIGPKQ